MKIEFVSHAGFIAEANGIKIYTDPWTKEKTFNDGWALLIDNVEVDYSVIDYIFVSHEHPDHFNFPTLKGIPEDDRKRIKILYQEHASLRLRYAFEKLGFSEVIELPIYCWTKIQGIDLYCGSAGSMDSFLAIRHGNKTILNLNDCVFREKQYRYIKRQIGSVDFLFTQFSFANWVGNDSDEMGASEKKVNDIKIQREIFEPDFIIPFASFVYFCNQENARMNDWINTPSYIQSLTIPGLNFMFPGDKIDAHNPHFDSEKAVDRYMDGIDNLKIDPTPEKVEFEKICEAIEKNLARFKKGIKYPFRRFVTPFDIFIHDLDTSVWIDPRNGTYREIENKNARYVMCSQVCWYTFNFEWGGGTLMVSGMYLDRLYPASESKYFFFQNALSTGFLSLNSVKQILRTIKFMWRKKWEVFYRFL